jgi:RNA polymerase sigma-70 factor (ECF subfamily)
MDVLLDVDKKLDEYRSALVAFANSLTKNLDDANDLFQETSFKIIKNKDKYKLGTNFRAWSYTIMRNIFINNYRKKKRRNQMSDTTDNDYYINSNQHSIANDGEHDMQYDELMSLVDQLSPDFRTPFLMRYRGYKYDEIAEELNLPLGTIKSRIHFARKRLKEMIEEQQMPLN